MYHTFDPASAQRSAHCRARRSGNARTVSADAAPGGVHRRALTGLLRTVHAAGRSDVTDWRLRDACWKRADWERGRAGLAAPVAAGRIDDAAQFAVVEPDQLAGATGVDDDVAGAVVWVYVHQAAALRAG